MCHRPCSLLFFLVVLAATGCQIQDVKYHYTTAMQAEGEGKLADALKGYLEVLKLNERHFTALCNAANICLLQKRYPEAKNYYIRALLERTNHAPGYHGLGLVYLELKDPPRAQESFRRATQHAPDLVPAWIMRGWSLYSEGKVQDAVKVLGEGLAANPTNVPLRYNLGWIHYMQQQYTNALVPLRDAGKLAPADFELTILLGKTLLKAGKDDEALRVLERVRALRKDHLFTRSWKGSILPIGRRAPRRSRCCLPLSGSTPTTIRPICCWGRFFSGRNVMTRPSGIWGWPRNLRIRALSALAGCRHLFVAEKDIPRHEGAAVAPQVASPGERGADPAGQALP